MFLQKHILNYLKNEVIVVKDLMFVSDAEQKYMAVLAAEILSRYAYLQYFANMTKSLKMNLIRGSSSTSLMLLLQRLLLNMAKIF